MNFDSLCYPYASRRHVMYAANGMVATGQPLASQTGLDVLRQGGNAIDAAVAMAACLAVVEPTANGIGGDAFALVWYEGQLYGLNSSGPAPQKLSMQHLTKYGLRFMPQFGWLPVTVPGAPAAWAELSERFGSLPFVRLLQPAIQYAEDGYPVAPVTASMWDTVLKHYQCHMKEAHFQHWFDMFTIDGKAPLPGQVWRSSEMARSLQLIAESKARAFYQGSLADAIDAFSRQTGGYLRGEDLAFYRPEWVEPIKVNYRGYDVWEIPPNGHGLVALMALNILKGFDFSERDSVYTYHRQIEAMKLAFADGHAFIAEPCNMTASVEQLLSDSYAAERRCMITDSACLPTAGDPYSGGTVYLAAADAQGNMVSYIQSNYMDFGSGLVVPGTGIGLHNRGCNFVLKPGHANCLAPGKRPYHTIIPGFLTKDGAAVGPFGVMGAFMQPQGHVQMVMNSIDFGLNPQSALDAPRWQWIAGQAIELEQGTDAAIIAGLRSAGHDVKIASNSIGFGRGQIIWRTADGVLAGGTEPRTDGSIGCW